MAGPTKGRQKPRLADIAAAAGVSIATVSRVLDDHPAIKPETKALVRRFAEAQGYPIRDAALAKPRQARQRKPRRSGSICVVMPVALPAGSRLANSFELNLLGGIGAAMRDHGLDLSIAAQAPYDDRTLAAFMATHPYDGVIFLGQSQFHDGLNLLAEAQRAFVVWGVDAPDQKYCSVGSDNFAGGLQATQHLIGLGRRRIAFIGQAAPITSAQTRQSQIAARMAGFRAALAAADLPAQLTMVHPAPTGMQAGYDAVQTLLARGVAFDAIAASSDLVAIGAMDALAQHGISVPGDVAIVGYDDAEVAGLVRPRLTTMRQDAIVAGDLLVSKLLRAMAGYQIRSERLPTELVIRDSCGAAAATDGHLAASAAKTAITR